VKVLIGNILKVYGEENRQINKIKKSMKLLSSTYMGVVLSHKVQPLINATQENGQLS
jgi:hypothetical protein